MKDQIVLSYHNSLLRQSDFSLLDPPHWLNDRVIGFYFESDNLIDSRSNFGL